MIYVVRAGVEHKSKVGEVLTECLATRYEMHAVRRSRLSTSRQKKFLGFTQLQNDGAQAAQIESVVGFKYSKETHFVKVEGVSRSIPVQSFKGNRPPENITWGMPMVVNKTEVRLRDDKIMQYELIQAG